MKYFKLLFSVLFLSVVFMGCEEDENVSYVLQDISAPTDVDVHFDISTDDTGNVTISPTATGANSFTIDFGDNSEKGTASAGESVQHMYTEGEYTVTVTAVGPTGLTSTFVRVITVSFNAPENLEINIDQNAGNPAIVSVSATADNALMFEVYFGDVENEEPTLMNVDEVIEHTYAEPGTYTVTVIAKSASSTTLTETKEVVIPAEVLSLPIDFESTLIAYTWTHFGPDGDLTMIVDNPKTDGINPSAHAAKYTKPEGSEGWAGSFMELPEAIDFSEGSTFKLKVLSPKAGIIVKMKIENATNGEIAHEVDVTNTVADEWEELLFDFSGIDMDQEYHKIVLFFDFGNAGDGSMYHYDDIEIFSNIATEPLTAAPAPTVDEANVISLYSDVYTNIELTELNPGWGQTTEFAEVQLEGNNTWMYTLLNYTGIVTNYDNPTDVSGMDMVHFDYWTPDAESLGLKLVNTSEPDGATKEDIELVGDITKGEWVSVDIPLSDYTTLLTGITQLLFESSSATVYIDNLYFYKEGSTGGTNQMDLPVTFEDASVNYDLVGFGGAEDATIVENPSTSGVNTSVTVAKVVKSGSAETWAGTTITAIENDVQTGLANKIPFTDTNATLKLMVYSPDAGIQVRLKVEDHTTPEKSVETEATTTVANAWEELTFDFNNEAAGTAALDLSYNFDKASVFFNFGVNGATAGEKIYYFDNLILGDGNTGGGDTGEPATAAPTPTAAESDVLSIFSDAYTDLAGTDFDPNWGQDTDATIVDIAGNSTYKLAGLNYQGVQYTESDVSDKTHLHIDFWTADATAFQLFLISEGQETPYDLSVVTNEWVSVDIPLTAYSSVVDLTKVFQFKFVGNGTVFVDNLYFVDNGSTGGASFELPVTFDEANVTYTHEGFGNASFEIIDNPELSGANSVESKVGKLTNSGGNWEGVNFTLDNALDFSSDKTITVKVYSTTSLPVLFKVEGGVNGERECEVAVTHGGTGWEELTFDFNTATKSYIDGNQGVGQAFVPTGQYKNLVYFIDGPGTTAGDFYLDDIIQ